MATANTYGFLSLFTYAQDHGDTKHYEAAMSPPTAMEEAGVCRPITDTSNSTHTFGRWMDRAIVSFGYQSWRLSFQVLKSQWRCAKVMSGRPKGCVRSDHISSLDCVNAGL